MQGKIRKAVSGFYYVESDGIIYQTRGRGNFRNQNITPLVGDNVVFESTNLTDGYVLEVLPRKNQLVRPTVANIDQAVVVTSMVEPNFSFNLLDRFLVTLEFNEIEPIIYLTKIDLLSEVELVEEIIKIYEEIGYRVIVATPDDRSIVELQQTFEHKLTVFMGQSGAGKSTLLNQILPSLELPTAAISESLGRGKHTTRHVELLEVADGLVADTPGFSAIDLLTIDTEELPRLFPEFVARMSDCRFRECKHLNEPNCAVKEAVEQDKIAYSRYEDYKQFMSEIENRRPVYKKKNKN
ncbi:ribosome small subunit-dependent GTPase A [uncultured Enterococcus sp.]|uniref:ribosome small subunit-dependent GTPase A n=1 Tax=uncultured Enterococcus sp. TaxID=167972 RepID=UPI0025F4F32E|nr:ribosome small subunit-dependent GTPase A [uncultured Enterococcus sp.]